MTITTYRNALHKLLTPTERRVFARLDTPHKIQTFIEKLPPNYELKRETCFSPRYVLKHRTAHCAEAAFFAAAVMMFHGKPAWLMDIVSLPSDHDHFVTLFRERGLWGAFSKTNHAVLRWRDPIYRSPRELAMTYAHEYNLDFGKKSMLAFSRPFSLLRIAPHRWVTSQDDLYWLIDRVDDSPHEDVAPMHALRRRRHSTRVELKSQDVTEWPVPKARRVAKTK